MANVTWTIKLYDLSGNPVNGMAYDGTVDNIVQNATDRRMHFVLNGVDSASFAMYLDDPMALEVKKFRVVKIWRNVNDTENSKTYTAPATRPDFSGFISGVTKRGQANLMTVNVQSPLWRLQSRFHIDNHYLVTDVDVLNNGLPWKQGPLMYRLIELVDDAFGATSATGIVQGTFTNTGPTVSPYFVGKGSNTWVNIMEDLLSRPGSIDIVPNYWHTNGQNRQMDFNTETKRGTDKSVTGVPFQYRTGLKNLLDVEEDGQIIPGEFGNYLWAVGQGGPNSGIVAVRQAVTGAYGTDTVGFYMKYMDRNEVKTLGSEAANSGGVIPIAKAELEKAKIPRERFSVITSPAGPPYYKVDYGVGDVIRLDAERGALSVTNKKQRIYEITLSMSDNNMEQSSVLLADDFTGKVTGT